MYVQCPKGSEEGIISLRTGVTDGCDLAAIWVLGI